jgi:kynurenine formamidase
MTDALATAIRTGIEVVDLGRPLFNGMPQSPNHPRFWHAYPRRHGDMVRPGGDSAANDWISMGTHVGTHIDAPSHVSHDGELHGGVRVEDATAGGRLNALTVDEIAPILGRGVLIDVAATKGVAELPAGYEITAQDLQEALTGAGVALQRGDSILIRSGWGRRFTQDPDSYPGAQSGVPGIGAGAAEWLAEQGPLAVGADTIALERLAPGKGHSELPVHRILLWRGGTYLIEALDLEELSARAIHDFTLILVPMKIVGGTGSPVRPLAVVSR